MDAAPVRCARNLGSEVFAQHGFDGGRVEQISTAAKSHDRMINNCFGSKEGFVIDAARRTVAP